jgi:hypothetical protein
LSAPTSAVPIPIFGPNGVVLPTEPEILTGVQADYQVAFNGALNFSTTNGSVTNPTPQGQLSASQAAYIGDNNAMFLWMVNGFDPAYNSGRNQDAVGRIYFMTRIPGAPSVQPCVCSGLTGVQIPVGQLAEDPATNLLWICTEAGEIPASGSITLPFACAVDGPTAGPESLIVYQYLAGLDSITPTGDAALGQLVENRAQFEARRAASTAANSVGNLPAVLGAVLAVPGVLDAYVYDNYTGSPLDYGGVTIGANSLFVCALGGTAAAVATAIWSKKAPGCNYYAGDTTVTVDDPNPAYAYPPPSYPVTYQNAASNLVAFYVLVTITNSPAVPSTALTQVQNAIVAAFAGADGGTRAKIGSIVYASRYYGPVFRLSATVTTDPATGVPSFSPGWSANIVSLQVGTSVSATFTGVIATGVLTASSVTGTIAVGNLLTDTTGDVVNGTTIVSQLSGTAGGAGTYQLGVSTAAQAQNVSSESMSTITMVNDVQMNIDQAPTVAAANVNLALVG